MLPPPSLHINDTVYFNQTECGGPGAFLSLLSVKSVSSHEHRVQQHMFSKEKPTQLTYQVVFPEQP